MSKDVLENLLKKEKDSLSDEEKSKLLDLLKSYKSGETMEGIHCPGCNKNLVYMKYSGPSCLLDIGCGFRYGKVS